MTGDLADFVAALPPRSTIVMVPDQWWHDAISQIVRGMRPQFLSLFKVRVARSPDDVARILYGWRGVAIAHESFRLEAAPATVSRFDALKASADRAKARPGGDATQARRGIRAWRAPA